MLQQKIAWTITSEVNYVGKASDYPDVPSIILRPRGLFGVGITVFALVYASVEKLEF